MLSITKGIYVNYTSGKLNPKREAMKPLGFVSSGRKLENENFKSKYTNIS